MNIPGSVSASRRRTLAVAVGAVSASTAVVLWAPPASMAAVPVRIHDIQGAAHTSALKGKTVTAVPGIVTAVASNGFYLQDPTPDDDPATSEAVFVFTSAKPGVAVGDSVRVAGAVAEFRPGGSGGTANLTQTEITDPKITVVATGATLPAPTVLGTGGRIPPDKVIDNAPGDVETTSSFDPATRGIDFYESLEGMRVQLNQAVAVGPTNSYFETPVIGDQGAHASGRSYRGGLVYTEGVDANPERVIVNDDLGVPTPAVDVDAHATSPIVGIMNYEFGDPAVSVTATPTFAASPIKPTTLARGDAARLRVATFNVENLAPTGPPATFARLATIVTKNLAAPDIIAVEEVQDDDGATDDGVVTAGKTWSMLIAAIKAAGGPTYAYASIDPVNDADGGQPGGNIRVGFLYNPARGVTLAKAPAGTSTTAESVTVTRGRPHLALNPGRIAPADPAWANSRKPLAAEFTYRGAPVFVVANHFVSKLGDDPLYGHNQPPAEPSRTQRTAQATVEHAFVERILAADPHANIVLAGDLNDFDGSPPVVTLAGADLLDLPATLPRAQRYTYVYEGNSEVLDHILVSPALRKNFDYHVVHVNSEFTNQVSDHDPQVAALTVGR